MLKRLLLSAAAIALAGGLAFAQAPMSRDTGGGRSVTEPSSSLSTMHWLVSDIYKANVYDNSEKKIGDVTDLMIDQSGNIEQAIIGVGGFLGAGQKDVAVPFKDLKVTTKNGKEWLVLNMTKDELMKAPAYTKPTAK